MYELNEYERSWICVQAREAARNLRQANKRREEAGRPINVAWVERARRHEALIAKLGGK